MDIAVALIAGGFIGAVLGFVGAGGAMLSVPILMYGFGFDPKPATTAALAVVLLANEFHPIATFESPVVFENKEP